MPIKKRKVNQRNTISKITEVVKGIFKRAYNEEDNEDDRDERDSDK